MAVLVNFNRLCLSQKRTNCGNMRLELWLMRKLQYLQQFDFKNKNTRSTVGFLLLQCFNGVVQPPGISRCRSQHIVSVESSSLFHHSIYL